MSGRGATGAVTAEWGKSFNRPVHLLEVDFSPYIYLTDAAVNVNWNGHTYLSSYFLGFSTVSETSDLLVNSCTISLTGVDQAVVAILLQENYLNRKIKIRNAMLDDNLAVIADPVLIFEGRMNRPSINIDPESGTVICSVDGVSHWTDFERKAGRHSNVADQQRFFPTDKGFDQVPGIPLQVFWGVLQDVAPGVLNPSRTRGP